MMNRLLRWLLLLLAFSLPFEIIVPILRLPWVAFTNVEIVALAALFVWVVTIAYGLTSGRRPGVVQTGVAPARDPLVWAALLFLALTLLSALLAPAHRLDALKFTSRIATGLAVFAMVLDVVRTRALLAALLWALVLGTGISALLGLAEMAAWPPGLAGVLSLFKEAPTRVGGELRASASFQYATIAAMYFEMTAPLAVALAATASRRTHRGAALAVALLATANVVFTFSRAGMATLALCLLLLLAAAWRRRPLRPLAMPALAALVALVAVTAGLAWQAQAFRTRLVTENDLDWYGAAYGTPASLDLVSGESTPVTVTVHNTGTLAWHTSGETPFALGYYWLDGDGQSVRGGHVEAPLPHAVSPGESVQVTVVLHASLPPGDYELVWGMLQHNILWFRHRHIPEARTAVHITAGGEAGVPPAAPAGSIPGGEMPALPPTVGRLDLWRAAVRMWLDRSWLGVGPDNFRLRYGSYLDLPDWDRRLHANNLYLELLAGWGLAGAMAFAGLIALIARRWLRLWRRAAGVLALWSIALGASLLAFFVHGFLDYFLEFVALYLLFWLVAALIVAAERSTGS